MGYNKLILTLTFLSVIFCNVQVALISFMLVCYFKVCGKLNWLYKITQK